MKIYLGGSLANDRIKELANTIRGCLNPRTQVFEDWSSAHPHADDKWRDYEKGRGHALQRALQGHTANQVFNFDRLNLIASDVFVLVLPCGKSGHLEAGFMAGLREAGFGKSVYALIDQEPDRYDVMYRFFDQVFSHEQYLIEQLRYEETVHMGCGRTS